MTVRERLRQLVCRHRFTKVWRCDHFAVDGCTTDWHNHGRSAEIRYCDRCGLTLTAETKNDLLPTLWSTHHG